MPNKNLRQKKNYEFVKHWRAKDGEGDGDDDDDGLDAYMK